MSPPSNDHDIPLTATVDGSTVKIEGHGDADLPPRSGAHRFRFTLDDKTGLDVEFSSLDTEDDSTACPPAPGENSRQIVGVTIGPRPGTASFTDNNNNQGRMDVSYQWNFTCNDPTKQVEPFDPIIINGVCSDCRPNSLPRAPSAHVAHWRLRSAFDPLRTLERVQASVPVSGLSI